MTQSLYGSMAIPMGRHNSGPMDDQLVLIGKSSTNWQFFISKLLNYRRVQILGFAALVLKPSISLNLAVFVQPYGFIYHFNVKKHNPVIDDDYDDVRLLFKKAGSAWDVPCERDLRSATQISIRDVG